MITSSSSSTVEDEDEVNVPAVVDDGQPDHVSSNQGAESISPLITSSESMTSQITTPPTASSQSNSQASSQNIKEGILTGINEF